MHFLLLIATLFTLCFPPQVARSLPKLHTERDPTQLLKDIQARFSIPQEMVRVRMMVKEADGQSRRRELTITRLTQDDFAAVKVRILAPTDVRGISYLSKWVDGAEEQWLYSPSQNKARRIVSGNRSQKFLDTEFNLDDFSADTYRNFENRIVKEEDHGRVVIIKSSSKENDSIYQRVLTWVDTKKMQIERADYYDKAGNLLKTVNFRNYQKFGPTVRARTIEVTNVQNNRSTVLNIVKFTAQGKLSKSDFSPVGLGQL